jgi:hypothetical protein
MSKSCSGCCGRASSRAGVTLWEGRNFRLGSVVPPSSNLEGEPRLADEKEAQANGDHDTSEQRKKDALKIRKGRCGQHLRRM